MDLLIAVVMGLSLAAASGMRVFLPLLVAAAAARLGWFQPAPELAWVATTPALVGLAVAAVAEVAAMHIPWLDHLLDTVASPAAVVAGAIVAASAFGDFDPAVRWTAAIIAGGGLAGTVQASTVALRAASTALTGGLGNPFFAAAESTGAVTVAVLAVTVPLLAGVALGAGAVAAVWMWRRWRTRPAA